MSNHYSPSEIASLRQDSEDWEDATEEEVEASYAFMLGLTIEQYREQKRLTEDKFLRK